MKQPRPVICRACRTPDVVQPAPGFRWYDVPLALVLLMLAPIGWFVAGYVVWRRSVNAKNPACDTCGRRELIPANSPEGKRLATTA